MNTTNCEWCHKKLGKNRVTETIVYDDCDRSYVIPVFFCGEKCHAAYTKYQPAPKGGLADKESGHRVTIPWQPHADTFHPGKKN
jgi:hypothetical protein